MHHVNPEPNDVLTRIQDNSMVYLGTAVSVAQGYGMGMQSIPKRRPTQTYEVKLFFGSDYSQEYNVATITLGNVLSHTINEYFIVFTLEDGDVMGYNLKTILTYTMSPNKMF